MEDEKVLKKIITAYGGDIEKVGYKEIELWPTTRKVLRTIYRDTDGNYFWFDNSGFKHYTDWTEAGE